MDLADCTHLQRGDRVQASSHLFFEGLTPEELALVLAQFEHRHFPAGTNLLQEGDNPAELYVIQAGTAEVLVVDRYGLSHQVDHARPGDVLGEMSLLTGQPVSATVRAITGVEALVLSHSDFDRLGVTVPRILRNLGGMLADRLRHSHLRALPALAETTTLLLNSGCPDPLLLAYALACSMSWHMRRPVLLLVLGMSEMNSPGQEWASPMELPSDAPLDLPDTGHIGLGAKLLAVRAEEEYSIESLASTLARLHNTYDHVLLFATGDELRSGVPGLEARLLYLLGPKVSGNDPSGPDGRSPTDHKRWCMVRSWVRGSEAIRPEHDGVLNVPPLDSTDEAALQKGMLPISTPAGKAIGWAARELCGLKVGLALGAGSEKGYAHLGVLQVLQRIGVPLDFLAGTSVGSGVAACLALGYDLRETERIVTEVGSAAFKFRFPGSSLLSSAGLRDRLRAAAGEARFEDLRVPLAVIAADVTSGREVVFRSGPLWPALLASMSIPGLYPAQRMGPYVLVDGGVLNPVPGDAVANLGADKVIAVKLATTPAQPPADLQASEPAGNPPSALQVLTRSMSIMQSKITTQTALAATVVIEPSFTDPGDWRRLRTFSAGRRHIEAGVAAAEEALPRLAGALPWLRGN
jgi:NTE family protein